MENVWTYLRANKLAISVFAESLAGRVSYLELTGLNLTEVGQGGLNQLWLRGGFPDAYHLATLNLTEVGRAG